MKTCAKCKSVRPLDEFHNDRRHADGKNTWCKSCKNAWTIAQGKPFTGDEDPQRQKECYTCKRPKSIAEFHRDKRRSDGRSPNCKDCIRSTYLRSATLRPADSAPRQCPKCGEVRTVKDFARDRNRADGIAIHCKPCRRAYYAANASTIQQKHREWIEQPGNRDTMVEWFQLNRERKFFYCKASNHCGTGEARRNQREVAIELARLWKQQRGVCAVTGRRLDKTNAQLDHIVPRSKGGETVAGNLRWVHRDVNYAKRDLTDDAFFRLCSEVVEYQRSRLECSANVSFPTKETDAQYVTNEPVLLAFLSNQGVNTL